MTALKTIENWALHAYVDGELDAAERAAIEKLLAEDAEARVSVESVRRQNAALKLAYGGIVEEPVPKAVMAALDARGRWIDRPAIGTAAAALLLMAGFAGGWFSARDPLGARSEAIAGSALVAHRTYAAEVRHPVEVAAAERDHLETWLSKRVGVAFTVPDLSAEGFGLLGGRLLAEPERPAAFLMYEDAEKNRITIFLTANPGGADMALRVEERGTLVACYWLDGPLGLVVAGELGRDRMMELARAVYDRFES